MWVEQSYKQVKHALDGHSTSQERQSDPTALAIGVLCLLLLLVSCLSRFCKHAQKALEPSEPSAVSSVNVAPSLERRKKISEKNAARPQVSWPRAVRRTRMAGTLHPAQTLLERLVTTAPPPDLQCLLNWLEQDTPSHSTVQLDPCQQTTATVLC